MALKYLQMARWRQQREKRYRLLRRKKVKVNKINLPTMLLQRSLQQKEMVKLK